MAFQQPRSLSRQTFHLLLISGRAYAFYYPARTRQDFKLLLGGGSRPVFIHFVHSPGSIIRLMSPAIRRDLCGSLIFVHFEVSPINHNRLQTFSRPHSSELITVKCPSIIEMRTPAGVSLIQQFTKCN